MANHEIGPLRIEPRSVSQRDDLVQLLSNDRDQLVALADEGQKIGREYLDRKQRPFATTAVD